MESSSKDKQQSNPSAENAAGPSISDFISSPNLQIKIHINKDQAMADESKKFPPSIGTGVPVKDDAPRKMPKLPIKPPAGLGAPRKDAEEEEELDGAPAPAEGQGAEGPYLCSECTKSFSSMAALKKHQRIHLERRYLCKECGNSFFDNSKLKRHMLVHTQIKTFTCPVPNCRKKFSLAYNLKSHVKAHNRIGDKFKCEVCLQVFLQAFQLNRHRVTAHMPNDVQPPADSNSLYQQRRRQRTSTAQARRKRPKIEPLPVGSVFPGVIPLPNMAVPDKGANDEDTGDDSEGTDKEEDVQQDAPVAVASGSPMIRPNDGPSA